MKKAVSFFLICCMMISLTSCARIMKEADEIRSRSKEKKADSAEKETDVSAETTVTEAATTETEPPETTTTETVPPETTVAITDEQIGWQSFSYTETDSDGYELKKTIKISGWMKSDDTQMIDAAWSKVSRGNEFKASPSEMGFHDGEIYLQNNQVSVSTYRWFHDWNDVLYAVGSLEVENMTDGFSISTSNTQSTGVEFGSVGSVASVKLFYSEPKVIYADQHGGGWYGIKPLLKSDHWGPVPFIIAFPLNQTPKHPDGDPDPANCRFYFGWGDYRTEFYIPFTWKDEPVRTVETESTVVETEVAETAALPSLENKGDFNSLMDLIYACYDCNDDLDSAIACLISYFGSEMTITDSGTTEYGNNAYSRYVTVGPSNGSPINVIGLDMGTANVSFKTPEEKSGVAFYMAGLKDGSTYPDREKVLNFYNALYDLMKQQFGEPNEINEDEVGWKGDYDWVTWTNTPVGDIWLCWGTNLWGVEGYNECIFSFNEI